MATSRTAGALEDLLDMLEDHFDEQPVSDADQALMDAANVALDDYADADRDPMDQVGDQVRMYLARIVQMVNQDHPELTGSSEMREALDILANPHGEGGVASMSNPRTPTPFATDEETLKREEREQEAGQNRVPYTYDQGQVREISRTAPVETAKEADARRNEDTRVPDVKANVERDAARDRAKREESKK